MAAKKHSLKNNLSPYYGNQALLIFYLRPARLRARDAAVAEALRILTPWQATSPSGGPFSEQGGLFWISLPADSLDESTVRLPWLGYTFAVDWLEPVSRLSSGKQRHLQADGSVRWKGQLYKPVRIYEEHPDEHRECSPDRRTFLLETGDGIVRTVQGYRGDGGPVSRRALPVSDARLLVNLAYKEGMKVLLDPFAGGGGIIVEAAHRGLFVLSADTDPALRHGLAYLGAAHCVADARFLPFISKSVDAVVTEPPYHDEAWEAANRSLSEMARILKPGGRISMLCAVWQAKGLRQAGEETGLNLCHDFTIQRKGLDCMAMVWEK